MLRFVASPAVPGGYDRCAQSEQRAVAEHGYTNTFKHTYRERERERERD